MDSSCRRFRLIRSGCLQKPKETYLLRVVLPAPISVFIAFRCRPPLASLPSLALPPPPPPSSPVLPVVWLLVGRRGGLGHCVLVSFVALNFLGPVACLGLPELCHASGRIVPLVMIACIAFGGVWALVTHGGKAVEKPHVVSELAGCAFV